MRGLERHRVDLLLREDAETGVVPAQQQAHPFPEALADVHSVLVEALGLPLLPTVQCGLLDLRSGEEQVCQSEALLQVLRRARDTHSERVRTRMAGHADLLPSHQITNLGGGERLGSRLREGQSRGFRDAQTFRRFPDLSPGKSDSDEDTVLLVVHAAQVDPRPVAQGGGQNLQVRLLGLFLHGAGGGFPLQQVLNPLLLYQSLDLGSLGLSREGQQLLPGRHLQPFLLRQGGQNELCLGTEVLPEGGRDLLQRHARQELLRELEVLRIRHRQPLQCDGVIHLPDEGSGTLGRLSLGGPSGGRKEGLLRVFEFLGQETVDPGALRFHREGAEHLLQFFGLSADFRVRVGADVKQRVHTQRSSLEGCPAFADHVAQAAVHDPGPNVVDQLPAETPDGDVLGKGPDPHEAHLRLRLLGIGHGVRAE